jgi:regulatory protein
LRRKGITSEAAHDAVGALEPQTEYDTALALAQRRRATMPNVDAATVARRLGGWLARKGYDGDTCRRVVREVLENDQFTGDTVPEDDEGNV